MQYRYARIGTVAIWAALVVIAGYALCIAKPLQSQDQKSSRNGMPTWRELRPQRVPPHGKAVSALAFDDTGRKLVSGSYDHTISVMRIPEGGLASSRGEFVRRISGHSHPISFITFLSDGSAIVSADQGDSVRVWRVSDGMPLDPQIDSDRGSPLALSPDGKFLAVGEAPEPAEREAKIFLYQISNRKLVRTLEGHQGYVMSLAFSPDGKLLVSGGGDATVRLWSVSDGKLLRKEKLTGRVGSLAFSADGKRLASGGTAGGISIWRVPELEQLDKWTWDSVSDLAFTPDGKYLVVCSSSDVIPHPSLHLVRLSDGERLQTIVDDAPYARRVAFQPDGELLAAGMSDGTIRFFVPSDGESGRE